MKQLNIVTLFCESGRQEVQGQMSLVGIFPDNIQLTPPQDANFEVAKNVAASIPRLFAYTRLNFEIENPPSKDSYIIVEYNNDFLTKFPVGADNIERAIREAKGLGSKYGGILLNLDMQPFFVPKDGRLNITYVDGDNKILSGSLKFTILQ